MTQDLNKEVKATKDKKSTTKKVVAKKITLKQLEQAENNYILATNDLVHVIIGQDFSGQKMTTKGKQERETQYQKFIQNVVGLNSLYIQFVYEKMQEVLKKNKVDVLQVINYVEEETEEIKTEYDYLIEAESEGHEKLYQPAEENQAVNDFFQNMDETFEAVLIELSRKVLTENGAIYVIKEQTLEQFKEMFDLNVLVQYTIQIDLAAKA